MLCYGIIEHGICNVVNDFFWIAITIMKMKFVILLLSQMIYGPGAGVWSNSKPGGGTNSFGNSKI